MKPRPNKSKDGRNAGEKNPSGKTGRSEPGVPLSSCRKWLFRLVALVVLPLLLLGGVEIVLQLMGYGYDTGFFKKIRVGEKDFLVNNENFSMRFFPPQLARWPGPVMMEAKKPANSYRIFILGESAARGEPEPAYAASRYLEALLDEHYPDTQFEVVNLGITAINSHVILPLAHDCAKAGGDLWIIYMGNNEMVGPFGAATVFGRQAPPLGFVRLNLAIQQTRLGQLLVDLGRRLQGKSPNVAWGGMKMFTGNQLRADDPRKDVVYQNFERNLNGIVRTGLDSGVKILLNTVAVNLKDCPPFASLVNSNLPAAERAQFGRLLSAASADQAKADFAGAAENFAQAAKLDPQFPELQYRWGECLLALTNFAVAGEHLQMACDVDALPFRADSRINGAIQKTGRQFAGDRLTFFDAAAVLAAGNPENLCGGETFYEHVHFNFDGNFRLGRAWAEQVEKMLPSEIIRHAVTNHWSSQEICERRLSLTDWNRWAVTQMVIDRLQRPPLSEQSNNAERLLSLRNEAGKLRQRMNPATAAQAVEFYQAAIQRSPQDHWLVQNYAEFLESAGDLKSAAGEWQKACELLPHDCLATYQAGRLLSLLDQWTEAEAALVKAVTLRPRMAEAWFELGNVQLGTGKYERAITDYERAAGLNPLVANYASYLGKAFSKLNRHAEAIKHYQQALQLQPDLSETHFALADEWVKMNQIAAAVREYAEVVRLKPDNALAHLDLGVMQARLGQFDEALRQFAESLRLEPGNQQAREYMERVQGWKNSRR